MQMQPQQNEIETNQQKQNMQSFSYRFKQQIIQAWKPVPTTKSNIILYIVLTIFFITVGVILLVFTTAQQKVQQRYDDVCTGMTSCTVTLTVTNTIYAPSYFYYGIQNFYQNHRKFIKYKSTTQYSGQQYSSVSAARADCGSRTTNQEVGFTTSVKGNALDPSAVAFPCGTAAYSFFNDTYTISGLSMATSGIAWPQDAQQYTNWDLTKQGIDLVNNQRWLIWLRPAIKNNFYKLYGKFTQDIAPGNYTVTISNNYPVTGFGQKSVVISNSNVFGSYNITLGVGYLVGGGISFILLIGFIILKLKQNLDEVSRKSKTK